MKALTVMRAHLLLPIIIFAALIPAGCAHIPITGEGYGLRDAVVISDPLKSWVVYTEYKDARPLYYQFNLSSGERLKAGLLTVDKDFVPDLTIMGLGLPTDSNEEFETEFEIPLGYGLLHVHGEAQDHKEFEPFTPSSYYFVLSVDFTVNETGTYYLVTDATTGSGKVGIVIGYLESFTVYEWVKVPFDVAFVHHWEGQDYLLILFPMIVVLFAGLLLNCYYGKAKLDVARTLAFVGALTYLGSAGIILTQMIIGLFGAAFESLVLVTPVFILLPAILGYALLREVWQEQWSRGQKLRVLIYGLVGVAFWAGYIIGPVLVIASVLIPARRLQSTS
ncbi:MAG: hypothetical protein JSV64_05460 [Candidatus Bathyarchaeota archaeon]|nr:MAG: hypothetical protein JSV64_05460 [Candidatus Bathyarchaeota archaeon]